MRLRSNTAAHPVDLFGGAGSHVRHGGHQRLEVVDLTALREHGLGPGAECVDLGIGTGNKADGPLQISPLVGSLGQSLHGSVGDPSVRGSRFEDRSCGGGGVGRHVSEVEQLQPSGNALHIAEAATAAFDR